MSTPSFEIKICGLTGAEDAAAALEMGADYLGFVLYDRSPRGITPGRLLDIRPRLPAGARCVGVFVNAAPTLVEQVARRARLHAVQLHGEEDPAAFAALPCPVWRAVRAGPGGTEPNPARWPAHRYVVDAAVPGRYGGTGITSDWEAAAALARRFPLLLAGGLTPANVAEAVRTVSPLGVDTASGVEAEPGRKDLAGMEAFIRNARRAAAVARCRGARTHGLR